MIGMTEIKIVFCFSEIFPLNMSVVRTVSMAIRSRYRQSTDILNSSKREELSVGRFFFVRNL